MTISTTTRTAGPFTGTGSLTELPFSFKVFAASDLLVVKHETATGVETTLTLTTDYTVTLLEEGGTVTLSTALASGFTASITSAIPATQPAAFNSTWVPSALNNALDRVTAVLQQYIGTVSRALVAPLSDGAIGPLPSSTSRASRFLAFDSSGDPIASLALSSTSPATAFAETLLDDVDAAAARTTLDVYSTTEVDTAIAGVSSSTFDAGMLMPFAGATAPTGWLLCYGQEVSRATYAALDTAIGETWGSYTDGSGGAGTTHLKVPDLRGRVLVGRDDMGGAAANRVTTAGSGVDGVTLGAAGGAQSHTLTVAQIPAHTHTVVAYNVANAAAGSAIGGRATSGTENTGPTGSGAAHPQMPPCAVINWIIKT